jgi:hypothetical protein
MQHSGINITKKTYCISTALLVLSSVSAVWSVSAASASSSSSSSSSSSYTKLESQIESKLETSAVSQLAPKSETRPESKTPAIGKSQSGSQEYKPEVQRETKPEKRQETGPQPQRDTYKIDYDIRPLMGKLDKIPVLNSNSPEIVPGEGILLSTLDPLETKHPEAHLNYAVKGPFAIFFHHINKQEDKLARKVLMISMLVFNPGSRKATLTFNSLASYVSQPDAPVSVLPPLVSDDTGKVFAGQGDRVVSDYVSGAALLDSPFVINVAPHSYALVTDLPIKVYGRVSLLNGRSYYAMAQASKPLQFVLLASFLPQEKSSSQSSEDLSKTWHPEGALANMEGLKMAGTASGAAGGNERLAVKNERLAVDNERPAGNYERLAALVKMADECDLAGPREGDKRAPTPPHSKEAIVYGRVSGVQIGAKYVASHSLALQQKKDLAVAYPISSVEQGTMGTGEVQAAPLVKRYANSAYAAHGNYCVRYTVDLKLVNKSKKNRLVDVALSTPLKTDKAEKSLTYFKEQDKRVFFRGVIKVIEADVHGKIGNGTAHYYHLVAHRGEKLPPFARFELEPGAKKAVRIVFYYTPDATPPQMLTVDSSA